MESARASGTSRRILDEILDRPKKTLFNDHVMRQIDYATLERLLVRPRHRLDGVNYEVLAERIERREMTFHEWIRPAISRVSIRS